MGAAGWGWARGGHKHRPDRTLATSPSAPRGTYSSPTQPCTSTCNLIHNNALVGQQRALARARAARVLERGAQRGGEAKAVERRGAAAQHHHGNLLGGGRGLGAACACARDMSSWEGWGEAGAGDGDVCALLKRRKWLLHAVHVRAVNSVLQRVKQWSPAAAAAVASLRAAAVSTLRWQAAAACACPRAVHPPRQRRSIRSPTTAL